MKILKTGYFIRYKDNFKKIKVDRIMTKEKIMDTYVYTTSRNDLVQIEDIGVYMSRLIKTIKPGDIITCSDGFVYEVFKVGTNEIYVYHKEEPIKEQDIVGVLTKEQLRKESYYFRKI